MLADAYLAEFSEPAGYLDFAAIGPVSRTVAARTSEAFGWLHAPPDGRVVDTALGAYDAGRETVARFMGVTVEAVTIQPSTSAGLFQVAFGLPAGNVVVPGHEFPANLYPWLRAGDRGGPEVRLLDIPDYRVTADRVAAAVDADTVAVAVSLVDFLTGFRCDLGALREAAGDALLVVDAIQGLGAVAAPLDAADIVVTGGQKWLRAGWGAAFMTASDRARERLAPTLTGWFGVADFLDTDTPPPHLPRVDAERFQEGSPVLFGAIAAAAALDVIEAAGRNVIHETVLDRVTEVDDVLAAVGAEVLAPWRNAGERAGIVSFRLPGEDPAQTAERLRAAGLVVSERGTWLRVSPHATTPRAAIALLRDAL